MLTKPDFDEIDKRTSKIIKRAIKEADLATGKDVSEAISDNNKNLATKEDIRKAISDNNGELFKIFLTKKDAKEMFVTKEEFNERMDKNFELLDKIYGHVKRTDEEQSVLSHNVQDYEIRLTKLEKPAFSN